MRKCASLVIVYRDVDFVITGVRLPGGAAVMCALPASEAAPALIQSASGSMFEWREGRVAAVEGGNFPEACPVMAHTPPAAAGEVNSMWAMRARQPFSSSYAFRAVSTI